MINFKGKKYETKEELANDFSIPLGSIDLVIEKLKQEGTLTIDSEQVSAHQKLIDKALKEIGIDATLEMLEGEEERKARLKSEDKKENKLTYDEVEINFYTAKEAGIVEKYAKEKLYLDTSIRFDAENEMYILKLIDVSEMEMFNLKNIIAINNGATSLMNMTGKAVEAVTGSTEFVAKNILVPTAKIGIGATIKVAGTLTKAVISAGGSLVSSTTQGVTEIKNNIAQDKEVLEARQELKKVSSKLGNFFGKFGGGSGTINIIDKR